CLRDDQGHAVMNFSEKLIGSRGDNAECPHKLSRLGILPGFPNATDCERFCVLHTDRVGLLWLLTLEGFPLEEVVDWYNAAALGIGAAEHRRGCNTLRCSIDGPKLGIRFLDPIRNQSPPQKVELVLACAGMLP